MKYPEWYEKYVKGSSEAEAKEQAYRNKAADREQFQKYRAIFGNKFPETFAKYQGLKYNNPEKWQSFVDSKQDRLDQMDFADMGRLKERLGNKEVRSWYLAHDVQIPDMIDKSQPIEIQARQAFELRNTFRTQARDLMKDQRLRAELDRDDKNKTFEELLKHKIEDKGLSYAEALEDILASATKTRRSVNESLGLG